MSTLGPLAPDSLDHCRCLSRFRPNIVFRGAGVPFVEDMIKELVISPDRDSPENGLPIDLVAKCTRCLVRYLERSKMALWSG